MGRLKNRVRFIQKAGYQVPDYIQDLMEALHPTVQILWDPKESRWALVQTIGGVADCVRRLGAGEMPTLPNTVYYLNACHPSRLRSKFAREQFLQKLDENPRLRDVDRRSSDAIRQGSSDLFDRMHGRVVVPIRR